MRNGGQKTAVRIRVKPSHITNDEVHCKLPMSANKIFRLVKVFKNRKVGVLLNLVGLETVKNRKVGVLLNLVGLETVKNRKVGVLLNLVV